MDQPQYAAISAILIGGLSGAITIFAFRPEYGSIDAGQPELAAFLILVISLGLVITGWDWQRERSRESQHYSGIPALTLGTAGITSVLGSTVVFRPWQYAGLAGGLRTLIVAMSIAIGSGLMLLSYYWSRKREMYYPLATLTGLLSLGLFYMGHQRFDLNIALPLLALLVAGVVLIPSITVLSLRPSESVPD